MVCLVQSTPVQPSHLLVRGTGEDAVDPVADGSEVVLQAGDLCVSAMLREIGINAYTLGGRHPCQSLLEDLLLVAWGHL